MLYVQMLAAPTCCIILWLVAQYDRCKLQTLWTCSANRIMLIQSLRSSNAPFLSPSLPTPEWLRDNPPLYNEQPWNVAHANGSGAMLANPYQQTDHTSATTPVLGQQAMPWARKPVTAVPTAPRQRLLAPAAPRRETVSRDARPTIAPVPNRRLVLPPSRSSNRVTKKKKVLQACERCR